MYDFFYDDPDMPRDTEDYYTMEVSAMSTGGHNIKQCQQNCRLPIQELDIYLTVQNTTIIEVFHEYMKDNESSERHQHNVLKGVIAYAKFLGSDDTIYEIRHKD